AIDFYKRAGAIREKLVKEAPAVTEYQTDLAEGNNRLVELQLLKGQTGADRALLDETIRRLEALQGASPKDASLRRGLGEAYALLGELILVGDPAQRKAAQEPLGKAQRLLETLCEQHP